MNRFRQPFIYGAVTAGVIFFIGWSTGMGGSLLPNIGFSVLMGVFAGILYWLVQRYAKPGSRFGAGSKRRQDSSAAGKNNRQV